MTADFSRYQSPGVYTESIPGPLLSVQSPTPSAVGIFGLSVGFKEGSETVQIPVDQVPEDEVDPVPVETASLQQLGIKKGTIEVSDPISGRVFIEGTDYDLVAKGAEEGRKSQYTLKRVSSGHLLEGDQVQVSYSYTNNDYFEPYTFFEFGDIQEVYGSPFNSSGEVQSELSLAARFAFMNGAQRVVCVAIDPSDPSMPALSEYEDALAKLEGHLDVGYVVPATGMGQIHGAVVSHVKAQSSGVYERRAIVGRDGSDTEVTPQQLITDAENIRSSRVILVAPSSLQMFSSELNRNIPVGGQYLAAALAGLSSSLAPATPLTRKQVVGFVGATKEESDGQKNLLAQNGVTVVEKTRNSTFRVRHGVSTDPSTVLTREWSIIGQQDRMIQQLRSYLDSDGLIGTMINDLTLVNIKASSDAALQSLVRDNIIRSYRDLKVRQLETTPDVVEVMFEWQAALPLNYIVVKFALNTSSGDVSAQTI